MRLALLFLVCAIAGCSVPAPSEPSHDDLQSGQPTRPETAPAPRPVETGLFTDEYILKLAKADVTGEAGAFGLGMFDIPALDVVPNGESRPRGEVFRELGLDDKRLGKFWTSGINSVTFLNWQVSPSYDISCMTARNDPDNEGLELKDPRRKVYGIRLMLHPK